VEAERIDSKKTEQNDMRFAPLKILLLLIDQ